MFFIVMVKVEDKVVELEIPEWLIDRTIANLVQLEGVTSVKFR